MKHSTGVQNGQELAEGNLPLLSILDRESIRQVRYEWVKKQPNSMTV
jgi:hypothetical protein